MERCVVVSPRHGLIRAWMRAYVSMGNDLPLVIVRCKGCDWTPDDEEYCSAAARYTGGTLLECPAERTPANVMLVVARQLAPASWALIDDSAEVTGNLDECFECADRSNGFVMAQFYVPSDIDNRHPQMMFSRGHDGRDRICRSTLMFFHHDANRRIMKDITENMTADDVECSFAHLYKTNEAWHEGFCDFSLKGWLMCHGAGSRPSMAPNAKVTFIDEPGSGAARTLSAKTDLLPAAPFERNYATPPSRSHLDDAVDAVFVIGDGSKDDDNELRYALRNLDLHCRFVRNVYICGACPSWVNRAVVRHLPWPDRFFYAKDANIIDKLRHACEQPGIAKRILFCSDDQFQTRECTWDDFSPRYLRRYSPDDTWYEDRNRTWHTRLLKTLQREAARRRFSALSPDDVYYYQPHMWMQIDRDKFVEYAKWCGYETRDDTIIASGYFNFAAVDGKPDFDHAFLTDETSLPDVTHLAYCDESYDIAMGFVRKMFPNPCRFER